MGMFDKNGPYVIEEEPGAKAYCACGKTDNIPYCDGSHQGTGISPYIVHLEEKKKVAICGCNRSKKMPFCDGAHKQP